MSTARPSPDIVTALFRAAGFVLAAYLFYKFLEWLCERPRAIAGTINQIQAGQIENLRQQVDQIQDVRRQVKLLMRHQRQDTLLRWCWFLLKLAHFLAWLYLSLIAAS